ncbi:COG0484: DnaJ-class molecular chaperone with C-terminal Zn finger domain [Cronobacter condimenti 1330]|uniref:COG0484: DnaJ-class molecular chaperone with C-terminal Zn finger domain n=1 Tax=Cronobacter condimenti 1330 TaxID=1073999 RepID=K8A1M7_9ENTR|nr:J domain-containing protein [Cronobacter condimenti]ALB61914.1 molecular chaperone DnaJ [Cronobacter condimenti 1330]CCJ72960.1 COG0484: DnaJ-class molecular chaperone with C-terminal Zn finger domain [Cronobacter condimenti 1330]
MDAWTLLGLEPTKDKAALRRAWAKVVKQHRPDQDPKKYQQLREAYEAAQRYQEYADEEDTEEESDEAQVEVTYRYVSDLPLTAPEAAPLQQADAVVLPDWDPHTLSQTAQTLSMTIVADEMAGCRQLETFLSTGLPDALAARGYFSERLADALANEQWLTRGQLEHVGRIMGWELDNYRSTVLPAWQVGALDTRVTTTAEDYRMVVERGHHQTSWLSKARWRLISEPQAPLPWWGRLWPGFLDQARQQVHIMCTEEPGLWQRINPVMRPLLSTPGWALSMHLFMSLLFWGGVLGFLAVEPTVTAGDVAIVGAIVVAYLGGIPALWNRYPEGSRQRLGIRVGYVLLSLALLAVPVGLFAHYAVAFYQKSHEITPLLYVVVIIVAVLVVCLRPRARQWWRWPIDIISGPVGFPVQLLCQLPWIINLFLLPFGAKLYSVFINFLIQAIS